MTLLALQTIKAVTAGLASVLVFVYRWVNRSRPGWKPYVIGFLVVLAAVSVFSYFDFGCYPKHGRFMNPHGWFHYYLGAKYSKELGYYDLYRAVTIANFENNGRLINDKVRDQHTYGLENPQTILREADQYKARFTPERWEQFKGDVRYFQSIFIPRRWPGVTTDKGYNATPTWNMVGGILANLTPTSSGAGMFFLLSLDLLLVVAMLATVWYAFGLFPMLITLIYTASHFAFFMYNVNEIRGAFLRLDWVTCAVMAICCVQKGQYKTAGGLMAYAGAARIFPLALLFGMGARAVWRAIQTRRIDHKYVEFFGAFSVVFMILVAASIWWSGGVGLWHDFLDKIRMHDQGLSGQRTGFRYVFLHVMGGNAGSAGLLVEHRILWRTILATVLMFSFACARRIEDYEGISLSYLPLFFLTAPTTYYHIGLLVPLFLFLPKTEWFSRAIGVAFLFAMTVCFVIFNNVDFPGGNWAISRTMSWIIMMFVLYMPVVCFLDPKNRTVEEVADEVSRRRPRKDTRYPQHGHKDQRAQ